MVQEMVVQVCYGTGNGCSDVLWHRKWLFRCAMAQEMVVQMCYCTETGGEAVLWHRKRL